MTIVDFFEAIGKSSGLLFVVTSMLVMGLNLTMAQPGCYTGIPATQCLAPQGDALWIIDSFRKEITRCFQF